MSYKTSQLQLPKVLVVDLLEKFLAKVVG